MASSTGSGSPSLDTINNIFGTSLEFPKCFRKAGTASNFELKTGSGHLGSDGAAHTANLNPTSPISSMMNGIAQDNGIRNIIGNLTVTGGTLFNGVVNGLTASWSVESGVYTVVSKGNYSVTSDGIKLTAAANIGLNGLGVIVTAPKMTGVATKMTGFDISACTGKKNFDIKHPSKEGHRLRYVSLEGPSADVFLRGKLKDSCIIQLPEYWKNLVDSETMSISLTPIGSYQELFVQEIEKGKNIIIKNNLDGPIHCHYVIYGERIDVEKNIPEYSGLTPADYPGDNTQCNINGL